MDMHMHGRRCTCRGRGWCGVYRSRRRLWLLLRCSLACFAADVACEPFQQEDHNRHHRARGGEGEFCGGPENELDDIHV